MTDSIGRVLRSTFTAEVWAEEREITSLAARQLADCYTVQMLVASMGFSFLDKDHLVAASDQQRPLLRLLRDCLGNRQVSAHPIVIEGLAGRQPGVLPGCSLLAGLALAHSPGSCRQLLPDSGQASTTC